VGLSLLSTGGHLSEANLSTLPETAPAGGKRLAEWLTLEGRRSSLVEWLGHCGDDSRIHGSFHTSVHGQDVCHTAPNQANIPAEFHGDT
jgi:hypothetical protein